MLAHRVVREPAVPRSLRSRFRVPTRCSSASPVHALRPPNAWAAADAAGHSGFAAGTTSGQHTYFTSEGFWENPSPAPKALGPLPKGKAQALRQRGRQRGHGPQGRARSRCASLASLTVSGPDALFERVTRARAAPAQCLGGGGRSGAYRHLAERRLRCATGHVAKHRRCTPQTRPVDSSGLAQMAPGAGAMARARQP